MFRRKESPKSVVLLLLLFAVPLSAGLGTRAPIDRAIVGNGMFLAGANGKLIFKKPAGYTDKDFLWQILYETAIDKHIVHTKIKMYANTIRELCLKNPDLLQKKRWGKTPNNFAMYNCHYRVGALLAGLIITKAGAQESQKPYKPSAKKAKKAAIEWAEKYAKLVVKPVLANTEMFLQDTVESMRVDVKNKVLDGKCFDILVQGYRHDKQQYLCGCSIYWQGESFLAGDVSLAECSFSYNDKSDKPELSINMLEVIKAARQHGLGRIMLRIVIEFGRYLAMEREKLLVIKLLAEPHKDALLPTLINYYKSFGFIPDFAENNYLTMHIDKTGKILTLQELKNS